jgi:hypothetical protein
MTAEDMFKANPIIPEGVTRQACIAFMKTFAKMHVTEALRQASEKSKFKVQSHFETIEEINNSIEDCTGSLVVIDKNSILNAYPLDKIK